MAELGDGGPLPPPFDPSPPPLFGVHNSFTQNLPNIVDWKKREWPLKFSVYYQLEKKATEVQNFACQNMITSENIAYNMLISKVQQDQVRIISERGGGEKGASAPIVILGGDSLPPKFQGNLLRKSVY